MNETGLNQLDSSVSDRTLTNTQTDRVALLPMCDCHHFGMLA